MVFSSSGVIVLLGGALIIVEFLLFLFAFERAKKISRNLFVASSVFVAVFVFLLCLHGVLAPAIHSRLFPDLAGAIFGGLKVNFVLGSSFAPMVFLFLVVFRDRFESYVKSDRPLGGILLKEKEEPSGTTERHSETRKISEARYRTLLEGQTELVCQFLPNTMMTYVNGAYARYFGATPDELMGKKFSDFLPDDMREKTLEHLALLTPENAIQTNEQMTRRADGEVRWHLWTIRAIYMA